MINLIKICLLLLSLNLLTSPSVLRAENSKDSEVKKSSITAEQFKKDLEARYAKAASIVVTMKQLKEASYLLRPLESRVKFTKNQEYIRWEMLEPNPFKLTIDHSGKLIGDKNHASGLDNPLLRERMIKVASLLKGFIAADFVALEQYFHISVDGRSLKAQPKSKDAPLPYVFTLEFLENLNLKKITMKNEKEEIRFLVESIEIKPTK